MNSLWKNIRLYLRGLYRIYHGIIGFIYDIERYIKYGGWKGNMLDIEQREYNSVMAYHGLEKSLSYKKRNPNSGWSNAYRVLGFLKIAYKTQNIGYHDKASKQTLEKFINLPENINDERSIEIKSKLKDFNFISDKIHGTMDYSIEDYKKGILKNPESFFFSRFSLREFKDKIVSEEEIKRAIKLSMKTPSVCNRQPWHIYHTSCKTVISKALEFQHGNKPFGKFIPNLMIVTIDLKAFFGGNEHYQHWIDGGIISMSLMYALHSLGIASCALNWSQSRKDDKSFRDIIDIKSNQTIIMMLAVGYPNINNKVCCSARRPIEEVFSILQLKVQK
jgi:nitroreductase